MHVVYKQNVCLCFRCLRGTANASDKGWARQQSLFQLKMPHAKSKWQMRSEKHARTSSEDPPQKVKTIYWRCGHIIHTIWNLEVIGNRTANTKVAVIQKTSGVDQGHHPKDSNRIQNQKDGTTHQDGEGLEDLTLLRSYYSKKWSERLLKSRPARKRDKKKNGDLEILHPVKD